MALQDQDTGQLFRNLQLQQHMSETPNLVSDLPRAGVFVCVGPASCGKTALLADLILRTSLSQCQYIVLAGDGMKNIQVPNSKTVLHVKLDLLDTTLHRILEYQSLATTHDNITIVLDNVTLSQELSEHLFHEATKLNIALILSANYMMDLSSIQRSRIDLLFVFRITNDSHLQIIWSHFFKIWKSFKDFKEALNTLTQNYGCLVYDKQRFGRPWQHKAKWWPGDFYDASVIVGQST